MSGEGFSRRCPDVVRLGGTDLVWRGLGGRDGPSKLQASRLDTEMVNLHRRVLTMGRRGALRVGPGVVCLGGRRGAQFSSRPYVEAAQRTTHKTRPPLHRPSSR